ncbi:outer membrane protein TolC [Desulfuromonas soudanensis]|uniref:Outer membrane protein TolC n=1 Tax=Desulfuromonas soudanensis TaxID=1603606 RepID=A0A0M4D6L9_9BACT|nr:TolC family protein [Desulfuromonas soudanensis]ALC16622.1 outer membrane protein TolC [Desulfuromonas soudanensis]
MKRAAKTALLCIALSLVLLGPATKGAAEATVGMTLDALVEAAIEKNPELQAAEMRWQMFERKVTPAQTLDDPRLGFSFSNYPIDSLQADETPMTGKEIQLSQMFPFPGKLGAKGEMAEQQALWYKGAWEDGKLQLAQKVKDAWYRLYYQDKAIAITQQNIDILDDFIRLTETKYEVGTGLQQDVLKAQVERSKLMDRLFTLRQQRFTVLADINTLLSRPSTSPTNPAEALDMTPVEPSLEALQELSQQKRPLYVSYQSLIDRFESQRKLARLDYYPDFNVWAGYRLREEVDGDPAKGTDFVSAGVSINLPIWRQKRSETVAEAELGIRMARRQYDDFRNRVHFTLSDAYAQMEKNRDLVALFKTGIIPQARQTFEASLAAYQVGDVDFLNLLDSLLTLYRYEIDYHRVLADYQRNVAQLEAAAGVSFASRPETPSR